jgi:hypothetical protein
MKFGFLSLALLACVALSGLEDPDLALNCKKPKCQAKEPPKPEPVFCQGADSLPDNMQPTYSYPANVKMCDLWGVFVTGSYLYWFAGQDGMDLATTSTFVEGSGQVVPGDVQENTIFQDGKYSSGYKLGLGYNINDYDNWVIRADYTSLHSNTSQSMTAPETVIPPGEIVLITDNVFYLTSWFFQNAATGQPIAVQKLSSKWKMHLDFIDLVASRPYYQGKSWTVSPYGGLRAAFIWQSLSLKVNSVLNIIPPSQPVSSSNRSHSWGIGPRAGLETHLLVGCGFRFQGNVGASLLFTQYTKVNHQEDPISLSYPVSYAFKNNYNCLRPMAEMNLGLGWSHCFPPCRCGIPVVLDLSATYDFNYLWSQNMMRTLNDLYIIGTNAASNDLYLHGLTLTATLNF